MQAADRHDLLPGRKRSMTGVKVDINWHEEGLFFSKIMDTIALPLICESIELVAFGIQII